MAESSIPVDLFNPGQVFACLGLLEAAEVLCGDARGAYDWSDPSNTRFRLAAGGEHDPVAVVLDFLASARVKTLAPARSELETAKWDVETVVLEEGQPYPGPVPDSPATLPVQLEGLAELAGGGIRKLVIDHWADGSERDTVKFWAGAGGYPGGGLVRDALELVRSRCRAAVADPFSLAAPQSSSFRFDWRRDNIPIDLGFNLNAHTRIESVGYPLVEVLAALGLSHARPAAGRGAGEGKLVYRYAVTAGPNRSGTESLLDPALLRAGLGGGRLPFPQRHFHMRLNWPGKENQARAITAVTEESKP